LPPGVKVTAAKFALGAMACALLPAALIGAVCGVVYDRVERRRDWQQQWDDLAGEHASWRAGATEGEPA
jgi:hypothetical protein